MSNRHLNDLNHRILSVAELDWPVTADRKSEVKSDLIEAYRCKSQNKGRWSVHKVLVSILFLVSFAGTSFAGVVALRSFLKVSATTQTMDAEILVPAGESAELIITDIAGVESSLSVDEEGIAQTEGEFEDATITVEEITEQE